MNKIDYSQVLEEDYKKKIELIKDKTNILHFSTGADSIASYLRLREAGIEPILVYKYFIKDLPMVNNFLDYFQKKFNIKKIYQFPHPLWAEMLGKVQFQKPSYNFHKFLNEVWQLRCFDKEAFDMHLSNCFDDKNTIYHFGLRYTDGIRRFEHLKNNGVMFQNKFYPVAPFKIGDIKAILNKYDCKLPIEYSLWGISFESPRAWNLPLIKDNCPETYKKILEWFPLVYYEIYRDRFNKLNRYFQARVKQFKDFAIDKKEYAIW